MEGTEERTDKAEVLATVHQALKPQQENEYLTP